MCCLARDLESRRCELKSCLRQRIFPCSLRCQIDMNLVIVQTFYDVRFVVLLKLFKLGSHSALAGFRIKGPSSKDGTLSTIINSVLLSLRFNFFAISH